MQRVIYKKRNNENLFEEKIPAYKIIKVLYSKKYCKPLLKFFIANRFISALYGLYMKSFLTKKMINKFVIDYEINTNESLADISSFKCFNDFFIRKIKADSRQINHNNEVLISPADGKILVYHNLTSTDQYSIKGCDFDLCCLVNDKKLINEYDNYSIAIIRLAPTDYHRFHFPTDGIPRDTKYIKGYYYSVSPIALNYIKDIFIQNKRTYCEIINEMIDNYLFIEIGATMVGSIKQTYTSNSMVKKGDEKGYFEFGGSTVILIFKTNTINFDHDLMINTINGYETQIKMGEQIGIITKIK
jgi:phosphatidylserine decarboxylase